MMGNFRIFALAWSTAYFVQFAAVLLGFGPADRGVREIIAGAIMAASWGFAAVGIFGDRKAAQ